MILLCSLSGTELNGPNLYINLTIVIYN